MLLDFDLIKYIFVCRDLLVNYFFDSSLVCHGHFLTVYHWGEHFKCKIWNKKLHVNRMQIQIKNTNDVEMQCMFWVSNLQIYSLHKVKFSVTQTNYHFGRSHRSFAFWQFMLWNIISHTFITGIWGSERKKRTPPLLLILV